MRAFFGKGACTVDTHKNPACRRKVWLIRLYILALVLILVMSLTGILTQTAKASGPEEPHCNVTIKYHGKTTRTVSFGETVAQLLHRLKLPVSGEDVVSHGMDMLVSEGTEIRIDRVVTSREVYASDVAHDVLRCQDPTLPAGTERILTEGVDGELRCEAEVTYINGTEFRRLVQSRRVTRPSVTEVIAVGTGKTQKTDRPLISDGFITLPTGEVLTYTDTATIRATAYTHTDAGCDFITSTGTTVRWGTVAVDPRYIPYGTRMFIMAANGSYVYGIAVAEDCGGDIKGDRMDLYMPTYEQCMEFGRRVCTVYFLG